MARLFKSTLREFAIFGAMGLLFILISVIDTYNTERPYTGESTEATKRDHLDLNKRLGYAILLNAGYGKIALIRSENNKPVSKSEDEDAVSINYKFTKHPDLACINAEKTPADNLTIAILAAEKYNRTVFERSIEGWIAKIIFKYSGKIPDFSLGLAQIRPSTIRKMVEENLGQTNISDGGILSMALDDCLNAKLAQQYVTHLFNHQNSTANIEERIRHVARLYNGSINESVHGMRYEDAILGAYRILCGYNEFTGNYDECNESESEAGEKKNDSPITGGIKFDVATVLPLAEIEWDMTKYNEDKKLKKNADGKNEKSTDIGDKENTETPNDSSTAKEELKNLVQEIKLVRVQLYERESKSKEFITQLSDKRKQWIIKYFVDLGFPQTNISIEKVNNSKICMLDAEDNKDTSCAKVTVVLNKNESISSNTEDSGLSDDENIHPSTTTPVANKSAPIEKESLNSVIQEAQKMGIINCLGRINQVANFLTTGAQQSGTSLLVSPQTPNEHTTSIAFEIKSPQVLSYASADFAPLINGCVGIYEAVTYWQNNCKDVASKGYGQFKSIGVIQNSILILDGGTQLRVFLMPSGTGCVAIKKEVVY